MKLSFWKYWLSAYLVAFRVEKAYKCKDILYRKFDNLNRWSWYAKGNH